MRFGESWRLVKRFLGEDVRQFMGLTGDVNPIHASQEAAEAAGFAKPVAHGMLVGSLFPSLISSQFVSESAALSCNPNRSDSPLHAPLLTWQPGAVYVSQTLRFLAPAYVGDPLVAEVEVIAVLPHKHRFK